MLTLLACAAWGSPALAFEAGAARVGPAPATKQLQVILPLKGDDTGLAAFARAVSTPGSTIYGQYEPVATLARRFGAPLAARQAVIAYLRSHGATRVYVDASGLLARATMTVPVAEQLFEVPLASFRASDGTRFVAPTVRVRVPPHLSGLVEGVIGLDTRPITKTPTPASAVGRSHVVSHADPQPSSGMNLSGTPSGCGGAMSTGGFTPNQYMTAYGYNPLRQAGLRGQGERMALIEIDGLKTSDLNAFARCFGLDRPAFTEYAVGGLRHLLAAGGEATLDFEVANAVAPDLSQIEVFEGPNTDQGTLASIAAPLVIPGAKPAVISNSIGLCEPAYVDSDDVGALRAEDRELELMAATGISFLAAAGDNGSADCTPGDIPNPHSLAVDYPASSPWATGVGGTNFDLTAANEISSELVWNDTSEDPDAAGGGGLSIVYGRPSYQNGVVSPNRRAVPDVAMLADPIPGYAIYCSAAADPDCDPSAPWTSIAGTSAAAPLLAAGVLLTDQDLNRHSRELIGFPNPLLYYLARSSAASSVFRDVTQYSNDTGPYFGNDQPLGCCSAGPGYDEASGWGSVNLAAFTTEALALLPTVPRISLVFPGGQRPVRAHQAMGIIACNTSCRVGAFMVVSIRRGPTFDVYTPVYSLRRIHKRKVYFRFSGAQERALRNALSRHRGIFAEAFAYAEDAQGNTTEVTPGKQVRITR